MNKRQESVRVLRSAAEIQALADPLRLGLLRVFAESPRTPKQAAHVLGIPTTRVYHHVKLLEREGLVQLVETRAKRGTREKYYATTASAFRLDPTMVEGAGRAGSARALAAAALESALGDVYRHVPADASPEECQGLVFVAQAELSLRPGQLEEMLNRIKVVLADYGQAEGEGSTTCRLTFVGVPVTAPER